MRRAPTARTDRFGRPLRALRPGEYRPAPAPPPPRPDQCVHGRDERWVLRCTETGRWRYPDRPQFQAPYPSFWDGIESLWCDKHRPEGTELAEVAPEGVVIKIGHHLRIR